MKNSIKVLICIARPVSPCIWRLFRSRRFSSIIAQFSQATRSCRYFFCEGVSLYLVSPLFLSETDIISLPASGECCRLLMIFANSLDPDQARQNVEPDLGPNRFNLDTPSDGVLEIIF